MSNDLVVSTELVDWYNLETGNLVERPKDWDNPHGNFAKLADTSLVHVVDGRGRDKAVDEETARQFAEAETAQIARPILATGQQEVTLKMLFLAMVITCAVSSAISAILSALLMGL